MAYRKMASGIPLAAFSVLPRALLLMSLTLVLRLSTGGGSFELGGTRWLSLRSLDRLVLVTIALGALGAAVAVGWRRATLSILLRTVVRSQPDRFLLLVLVSGVGLRLTLYIANPIGLFPYLVFEETLSRFLLTNLFMVGGTWCVHAWGGRTGQTDTGLLAAILFTLSPWTAYFGRFHVQQAAAFSMMMAGAFCFWCWLNRAGPATLAVGVTAVAILLDPVNFHLVGVLLIAWWCGSERSWQEVAAILGALLGLSIVARATFVPSADLWMPVIPRLSSPRLDRTTLEILYDRFFVLGLPAGGSVLFFVGLARWRRRQLLAPAWLVCAALWLVWVDNIHLVQSAIYFPLVAVGSLVAAQGATSILAVSRRSTMSRNLGFLVVVALVASVWWGHDYAFRRIYRWNTALVADRERVAISSIDGFRRHGAWYFVSEARTPARVTDRVFFDAMAERYGFFTRFNRVVFPILRKSTDYYRVSTSVDEPRVPHFLEGEELRTPVGRIVSDGLASNGYAVRGDEAGVVGYSAYLGYGPGRYAVDFRIRMGRGSGHGLVARLHVARRDESEPLAERALADHELGAGRGYVDVTLAMSVGRPAPVQFRVLSTGVRSLWVDRIRVRLMGTPPHGK